MVKTVIAMKSTIYAPAWISGGSSHRPRVGTPLGYHPKRRSSAWQLKRGKSRMLKGRNKQPMKYQRNKIPYQERYVPASWKEVWGDESEQRNLIRNAADKAEVRLEDIHQMSDKQVV